MNFLFLLCDLHVGYGEIVVWNHLWFVFRLIGSTQTFCYRLVYSFEGNCLKQVWLTVTCSGAFNFVSFGLFLCFHASVSNLLAFSNIWQFKACVFCVFLSMFCNLWYCVYRGSQWCFIQGIMACVCWSPCQSSSWRGASLLLSTRSYGTSKFFF